MFNTCAFSAYTQAACAARTGSARRSATVCSAVRVLLDVLLQQSAASAALAKQLERLVARAQDNVGRELDVWEERLGSGMTAADAVMRDMFDVDESHASVSPAATDPRLAQQKQSTSLAQFGPSLVPDVRPLVPATRLPYLASATTAAAASQPSRPSIS